MAKKSDSQRTVRDLLDQILNEPLPVGTTPEDIRAAFGMMIPPEDTANMTYREIMLRQLVLKACTGNDKSIGEVLDRLVGKPTQTVESKVTQVTYHDFLMSLVEKDQADKHVIDVEPEPEKPETDILKELL